jgi:hypothetical protein
MWVIASAAGMFIGVFGGFFSAVLTDGILQSAFVLIAFEIGLAVGFMQWLVLRQRLTGAAWWIMTNVVGSYCLIYCQRAIAIWGVDRSLGETGELLVGTGLVALCGAVTGTLQWLVLRRKVAQAGWWILATTVSWGLCRLFMETDPWGSGIMAAMLSHVTAVALLGALTGGVLVWLLRHQTQAKINDRNTDKIFPKC